MNFETATSILAATKPARRKRERYRQRDEMQHRHTAGLLRHRQSKIGFCE